jgi:hypothetical protein
VKRAPTLLQLSQLKHDEATVEAASRTFPGQAHWGGGGPPNTTCRLCRHWVTTGRWDPSAPAGQGMPKPARCAKSKALAMARKPTPPIPHNAESCRHFEPATHPQPLYKGGPW